MTTSSESLQAAVSIYGKLAKQKLRQKGKVTVNARITFTPNGGTASSQTAKLKIKGKKK